MLDRVDRDLIAILSEDGRLNNNEIAKRLGISEGTVRNRLKRLVQEKLVKVSGLFDPDAVPEKQLTLLGVKVAVTKDLDKIAERISRLPGVESVCVTSGRYDIMIETWLKVKYGLIEFLNDSLGPIEGIISTESFVVLKSYNKWISSE